MRAAFSSLVKPLVLASGIGVLVLALAAAFVACGPSDFDPATLIESVRILASRSDHSYAQPGSTVHSQVLAVDARPDASANEPMKVYWLPFVCINPPNDAYYACFSQLEGAGSSANQAGIGDGGSGAATISGAISAWDGGAEAGVTGGGLALGDGGSLRAIPTGTDISAFLIQGPQATFQLPSDIVTSHKKPKGVGQTPYGLAIVFNIACAGHIEILTPDPTNPNPAQVPIGCFNTQHQQLTANDYVLGYTEVFAYDKLTNANPTIQSFTFRDASVPLEAAAETGVTFPVCEAGAKTCPDNTAILNVPDASWQRDPQNLGGPDGGPLGEQIWVDYYSTIGTVDDAILVFDPSAGRVKPPHQEQLQDITKKQHGTLWAVVHDNRGGASWLTLALHAN
jgi:hypothetical protein